MSTAQTTTEQGSPRNGSAAMAAAAAAAGRNGTTAAGRNGTTAASAARNPSGRVFRGRSIAELIPRIEEELGAEAIVLRRQSGLEGGIAGFFQRPFVEIEAQAGNGRLDLYDGGPEMPPPAAARHAGPLEHPERPCGVGGHAGGASSAHSGSGADGTGHPVASRAADAAASGRARSPQAFQALELASVLAPASGGERPSGDAFANALAAAGLDAAAGGQSHRPAVPSAGAAGNLAAQAGPQPAASPPPAVDPGSRTQRSVQRLLLEAGIAEEFADELIAEAKAHLLPFDPRGGLRRAVGLALQRRIASAAPLPRRGGLVALVGPGGSGKTRCVAALAGAYRSSGEMPVGCASILATPGQQSLKMLMSPRLHTPIDAGCPRALRAVARARGEGIALLDTPSLSPADGGAIRELARLLGEMAPDRVIVALPATLSGAAAAKLLTALRPLRADALAITHLDGADQIGVALEAACTFGLAPEFLLGSRRGQRVLEKAHPAALAKMVLG